MTRSPNKLRYWYLTNFCVKWNDIFPSSVSHKSKVILLYETIILNDW